MDELEEDDLFSLVRKGQLMSVREMLSSHPDWVNLQDRLGWTALHYASMLGNVKVVVPTPKLQLILAAC
jgi:ankyrin repeat protein